MQLIKKKRPVNIKAALTLAASALLGTIPKTVIAADNTTAAKKASQDTAWDFESALLIYSESDRVSAAEAILNGQKTFANDEILNL
tara:strand:- start:2895 stop:3152 length:258 start_codon:yes stop_codon:yes gene_type:complete